MRLWSPLRFYQKITHDIFHWVPARTHTHTRTPIGILSVCKYFTLLPIRLFFAFLLLHLCLTKSQSLTVTDNRNPQSQMLIIIWSKPGIRVSMKPTHFQYPSGSTRSSNLKYSAIKSNFSQFQDFSGFEISSNFHLIRVFTWIFTWALSIFAFDSSRRKTTALLIH